MPISGRHPVPTADNASQWRDLLAGDDTRIIRSPEDWEQAMADDSRRNAILPGCDAATVKAFGDTLVFRDGGLASANGEAIADKLTFMEYIDVWGNFGMGEAMATEHMGEKCDGMHNWVAASIWYTCTPNC